jgi:GMP synthase (glutamine-hydrolysing)
MQILIIDNNIDHDSWGATDLRRMTRLGGDATIHVRRAPQEDLPKEPHAFDRIIVSGSKTSVEERAPWIEKLDAFIRRAVDRSTPLLGVCYGHQALARALGGERHVRKAERGEFGWVTIELTGQARGNPLFKGLGSSFHSFEWHNDEVSELPKGMRLLARSETCPIQACELENKPVYGVQFHPERALEEAEKSLAKRFKENPKAAFVNRQHGKKLFDAQVGETIFKNFLSLEQA